MATLSEPAVIPAHVPRSLVFDFDLHNDPRLDADLHIGYASLHDDAPDLFFTPRNGGHWVATRYEHVQEMMFAPEIFSSVATPVPMPPPDLMLRFPPLDMDPPQHRKYRALVNRYLQPSAVKPLEPVARALAAELIGTISQGRSCDYVTAFAQRLPVGLWMALMGMDLSRREQFIRWAHIIIGPFDAEDRDETARNIRGYFEELVDARVREPGVDPISQLLAAEIDGERLSRETVLDICNLMFTAGLDTVTNMLTFHTKHLAENLAHQRQLRADPERITQAVEEMLRRHAIVNTGRLVTRDTILGGVSLKRGDQVLAALPAASNDPRRYGCPLDVDFARDPRGHLAFNTGPHNCAGVHLARMELRVCLEEWLKAIPEFTLAPGYVPITRKGQTMGLENLELVW